jgi:transposase
LEWRGLIYREQTTRPGTGALRASFVCGVSTLADWVGASAATLMPLVDAIGVRHSRPQSRVVLSHPIARGRAGPKLLAHILFAKYGR